MVQLGATAPPGAGSRRNPARPRAGRLMFSVRALTVISQLPATGPGPSNYRPAIIAAGYLTPCEICIRKHNLRHATSVGDEMKESLYLEVVDRLESGEDPYVLAGQTGVPYDTVVSIFSQISTLYTRRLDHVHKGRIDEYYAQFIRGESLRDIAEKHTQLETMSAFTRKMTKHSLPPVLLARKFLQTKIGLASKDVTRCIREPELLTGKYGLDDRWKREVQECISADATNSPLVDRVKRNIGLEYEYILEQKLKNLGCPFVTEEQLRQRGFPKTPDIKLEIPFAVGGRPVCWIDSKASFGDKYAVTSNQFDGYVNRFGPGMVIFWFGFIDELNNGADVIFVDDFPNDIVRMAQQSPSPWAQVS